MGTMGTLQSRRASVAAYAARRVAQGIGLVTLTLLTGSANAQAWPSKTMRLIIGQPPAGLTDVTAHLYAQELEQRVKQTVIIENRPGASGLIGARAVATAAPDGHTFHISTGINQSKLLMKSGMDLFNELAPVSILMAGPWALFARPGMPATFAELVAQAKSKPGQQYNYASPGVLNSLAMVMVKNQTGIDFVNVNYKGQTQIAQGLGTAEVDLTISTPPPFLPLLQSGKVRAYFTTRKTASLPGVPTAEEVGLTNFQAGFNLGAWVPVGTPRPVIDRLSTELAAVTALPRVQGIIRTQLGAEPVGSSADEMRRTVENELRFWGDAVKSAKYEPE